MVHYYVICCLSCPNAFIELSVVLSCAVHFCSLGDVLLLYAAPWSFISPCTGFACISLMTIKAHLTWLVFWSGYFFRLAAVLCSRGAERREHEHPQRPVGIGLHPLWDVYRSGHLKWVSSAFNILTTSVRIVSVILVILFSRLFLAVWCKKKSSYRNGARLPQQHASQIVLLLTVLFLVSFFLQESRHSSQRHSVIWLSSFYMKILCLWCKKVYKQMLSNF